MPQPRPAQEEHSAPRTHSQLRLARSHARHARNENEDETKPISRFRVAFQAPLNLRLGREKRRFSQGDFHKDQKRPSGNSLFHDPDSFALALGSEIDVYRHGLDRTFSENNNGSSVV